MGDPIDLLHGNPWMFSIGDFVTHRNGCVYRIAAKALRESDMVPVYVYSSVLGGRHFTTWTRPRAEMEDGRFVRTMAADVSDVAADDPLRAEHAELVDVLADLVDQHLVGDDGAVDSVCIGSDARAIRILARLGRIRLDCDGPGRNASGVMVRGGGDE